MAWIIHPFIIESVWFATLKHKKIYNFIRQNKLGRYIILQMLAKKHDKKMKYYLRHSGNFLFFFMLPLIGGKVWNNTSTIFRHLSFVAAEKILWKQTALQKDRRTKQLLIEQGNLQLFSSNSSRENIISWHSLHTSSRQMCFSIYKVASLLKDN